MDCQMAQAAAAGAAALGTQRLVRVRPKLGNDRVMSDIFGTLYRDGVIPWWPVRVGDPVGWFHGPKHTRNSSHCIGENEEH